MNKYTDKQKQLLDILDKQANKESPLSQFVLGRMLGVKPRTVRVMIEDLRDDYCICYSTDNTNGGYWLTSLKEDADEFILKQRFRAMKILGSTKGARKLSDDEWDKEFYGKTINELLEDA